GSSASSGITPPVANIVYQPVSHLPIFCESTHNPRASPFPNPSPLPGGRGFGTPSPPRGRGGGGRGPTGTPFPNPSPIPAGRELRNPLSPSWERGQGVRARTSHFPNPSPIPGGRERRNPLSPSWERGQGVRARNPLSPRGRGGRGRGPYTPSMRPLALAAGACACLAAVKLAADRAVRSYEDLPFERTVPLGRTATVDGLRLHYLDEGAGPAIVLLHGLGASTFAFRHNVPALACRFRVVAVDLPGHGLSGRDAPDLSLSAQARYVSGLLDQLGIERAVVVGHSMGGGVAQRIAIAQPGRVAGLVLIASTTDRFFKRAAAASPLLRHLVPVFATAVLHNRFVRPLWSRAAVFDPAHLAPEVIAGYAAPGHVRGSVAAYQRLMRDRGRDADADL